MTLFQLFSKYYSTILTKNALLQFNKYLTIFELRDDHPYLLNNPLLGTHRLIFTQNDREVIFDFFNVDQAVLKSRLKEVKSYNPSFIVASDPFNILMIWLTYLSFKNKSLPAKLLKTTRFSTIQFLQYKFFSSKLFNSYKYLADKDIMQFTIDSLSYKSDIKKHETWKKVLANRTETYISPTSNHKKAFTKFKNDREVYYAITDIQTRIRSTINIISRVYYDNLRNRDILGTYDATIEIDGKKVLKEFTAYLDKILTNLTQQLPNQKIFITDSYVAALNSQYPTISTMMITNILRYFSNLALEQKVAGTTAKITTKKSATFYEGIDILLEKLVVVIFQELLKKKIPLNNKLIIFNTVKKIFKTRISNQEFVDLKNSIYQHIQESKLTTRKTTITYLVTIFSLYIFLKVFETI